MLLLLKVIKPIYIKKFDCPDYLKEESYTNILTIYNYLSFSYFI